MVDKLFVATKAFIVHHGKVLLLKESSAYADGTNASKFDVVGGRIKPGERFDESLLREIKEETGMEVTLGRPFFVNEWRPQVQGEQWQIVATFLNVSLTRMKLCSARIMMNTSGLLQKTTKIIV